MPTLMTCALLPALHGVWLVGLQESCKALRCNISQLTKASLLAEGKCGNMSLDCGPNAQDHSGTWHKTLGHTP